MTTGSLVSAPGPAAPPIPEIDPSQAPSPFRAIPNPAGVCSHYHHGAWRAGILLDVIRLASSRRHRQGCDLATTSRRHAGACLPTRGVMSCIVPQGGRIHPHRDGQVSHARHEPSRKGHGGLACATGRRLRSVGVSFLISLSPSSSFLPSSPTRMTVTNEVSF